MASMKSKLEAEKDITRRLMELVTGHWDKYLRIIVPELGPAIDAALKGSTQHFDCVFQGHGAKGKMRCKNFRGSRFVDTGCVICTCTDGNPVSNGLDTIMRARGVGFKEARDMLLDAVGGGRSRFEDTSYTPPPPKPSGPSEEELRQNKLESDRAKRGIIRIWNEVVPLWAPEARAARLWLKRRHIWEDIEALQDLGFHPGLSYGAGSEYLGDFPAMVGMVRGIRGDTRTVHRTYLTETGQKAPVPKARKLYTVPKPLTASGGAIQFDRPGIHLNVAEGIESALSARIITGYQPTWAMVSADMLSALEIPGHVKAVTVWADKDRSDTGQQHAAELVLRLRERGIAAVAMLPPVDIPEGKKGVDWNDLVMNWGLKTIRENHLYRQWLKALDRVMEKHSDSAPTATSISKS